QPAVDLVVAAVELRLAVALLVESDEPRVSQLVELVNLAELDRLGRAGLGAGRRQVVLQPVVAEGALVGGAGRGAEPDHVVGTGRDAVPAAVTDVLLDEDCVELGPDDGIGRADLEAGGVLAV